MTLTTKARFFCILAAGGLIAVVIDKLGAIGAIGLFLFACAMILSVFRDHVLEFLE